MQTRIQERGVLLVWEGVDGGGKSFQITQAYELLKAAGVDVVLTREPGGTPLAEALRELVLRDPMDALTEALLVFAARRDHFKQVILPALDRGAVVLCDRFVDSTFAYQGHGRGFDRAPLEELESWVLEGFKPDLTLLYDIDPSVAAQRRAAVRGPDRFEQQDLEFFERVRAGYEARRRANAERYAVINSDRPRDVVWSDTMDVLRRHLSWLAI